MSKNTTTPEVFLNQQSKDTKKVATTETKKRKFTQIQQYYNYLLSNVATNSMCSDALGIPQKNLTRYKREFEKNNLLWEVFKAHCKLTGFKASFLTTNPEKAPEPQQLSLFDSNMGGVE
ncbi:MAG: hypothetical protein PHI36_02500 [Bacteroidales bacterium]|nr:hypothetical protein [Bacteroidales bacterium]